MCCFWCLFAVIAFGVLVFVVVGVWFGLLFSLSLCVAVDVCCGVVLIFVVNVFLPVFFLLLLLLLLCYYFVVLWFGLFLCFLFVRVY